MVELGAVGCTSLIGADPAEGCWPELPTELEGVFVDEVVSDELGTVGCTVVSGKPLDGSPWLLGL